MVVVQRNEVSRNKVIYFLAIVLSAVVILHGFMNFSQSSQAGQLTYVLLIQREEEKVVATNALHEGFKLRFLRDILGENVTSFSDEDRARWKPLENDGFYAALTVRNVRKLIMLRLCTMMFDDVFAVDYS